MRTRFFRPIDPAYVLKRELLKKAQENLAARTFSHVTPEANLEQIRAEGLQAKEGGSERGISGLDAGLKPNSKNFVHLGKEYERWIFNCVPFFNPSHFYTRIFNAENVRAYTLTVVLPDQRVFSEQDATHQVMMHSASPLFAPHKTVMPLVEQGQIIKDWADPLPGRYKTRSIPADFVFFKPLKEVLRKPGETGVDEFVSEGVLNAITSDKALKALSRETKLEYLRAVVHGVDESLYPVVP